MPKPSLEQGVIFKMEDYAHKVERPKEELLQVRDVDKPSAMLDNLLAASRIADTGKDESSSCQIVRLAVTINTQRRRKLFH